MWVGSANGGEIRARLFDATGAGVSAELSDPGDTDNGPNDLQNTPNLDVIDWSLTSLSLQSALNSAANAFYRIEYFAARRATPVVMAKHRRSSGLQTSPPTVWVIPARAQPSAERLSRVWP